MPQNVASDQGMHCLISPVFQNTNGEYDILNICTEIPEQSTDLYNDVCLKVTLLKCMCMVYDRLTLVMSVLF